MIAIEFFIPVEVLPKQTKRNRIATNRRTGRQYTARYTPAEVRANAEALALYAKRHVPNRPLRGPVLALFTFWFPFPARTSKSAVRHGWLKKHTAPDLDNLSKQLCDVLEGCGFFEVCDGQISDQQMLKLWGPRKYIGVNVRLEELE